MAVPTPILLHGEIGGPACWGAIDGRFAGVSLTAPGQYAAADENGGPRLLDLEVLHG